MADASTLKTGPVERLLAKTEGTPNGIDALAQLTRSPLALDTCNAIIAEMAMKGLGRSELDGAVYFVRTFINITMPPKELKSLPVKTLAEG